MTLGVSRPLRAALGLFLGAAAVATLAAQQQSAQQPRPPRFRGGANFVYVDVYPRKDGRVVPDLAQADFELLEDGKPQAIETFQFVRIDPEPESARRDPNNGREMAAALADPTNRAFLVFLDYLHVRVDGSHAIRQPLVNAMERIIGPRDLFAVATPATKPTQLTFGRRTEGMADQLARYWPWGLRDSIAPDLADPMERLLEACFAQSQNPMQVEPDRNVTNNTGAVARLDQELIARRREDRTLTSLETFIEHLGRLREARTSIVIVSDGWRLVTDDRGLAEQASQRPTRGPQPIGVLGGTLAAPTGQYAQEDPATCNAELLRLAMMDNRNRLRDIIAKAQRANVSIYPITPSGLAVSDSSISRPLVLANPNASRLQSDYERLRGRIETLQNLAENTDGIAVVNTNDLNAGLTRIVNDVSAYYLLGYYSTNSTMDGRYRRIEVKLRNRELEVRARRGYMAPAAGESTAAGVSAAPVGLSGEAEAALAALGRLRPDAELFIRPVVAGQTLLVAAELGRAGRGRTWATTGAAVTIDVSADGLGTVASWKGQVMPNTRGVLAAIPVTGAGPWRVSVAVGDGPDRLRDEVPAVPSGEDAVGEALLFRATPAARSPLVAVADHQFRRAERVHVEWPLNGEPEERSARLLGRDGRPLAVPVTVTLGVTENRPRLAADVLLASLSDGEYFIELTVKVKSVESQRWVALRVVR